jgi:hypothetical protein
VGVRNLATNGAQAMVLSHGAKQWCYHTDTTTTARGQWAGAQPRPPRRPARQVLRPTVSPRCSAASTTSTARKRLRSAHSPHALLSSGSRNGPSPAGSGCAPPTHHTHCSLAALETAHHLQEAVALRPLRREADLRHARVRQPPHHGGATQRLGGGLAGTARALPRLALLAVAPQRLGAVVSVSVSVRWVMGDG